MGQIELDSTSEDVRRFFLHMEVEESGTVITLHGEPLMRVTSERSSNKSTNSWNDTKNDRRCELINRKYSAGLNEAEQSELDLLQMEMYRHREIVAPIPVEFANKLF